MTASIMPALHNSIALSVTACPPPEIVFSSAERVSTSTTLSHPASDDDLEKAREKTGKREE
jgi:hypothetical protein